VEYWQAFLDLKREGKVRAVGAVQPRHLPAGGGRGRRERGCHRAAVQPDPPGRG
jgi:hypothetical protein